MEITEGATIHHATTSLEGTVLASETDVDAYHKGTWLYVRFVDGFECWCPAEIVRVEATETSTLIDTLPAWMVTHLPRVDVLACDHLTTTCAQCAQIRIR